MRRPAVSDLDRFTYEELRADYIGVAAIETRRYVQCAQWRDSHSPVCAEHGNRWGLCVPCYDRYRVMYAAAAEVTALRQAMSLELERREAAAGAYLENRDG